MLDIDRIRQLVDMMVENDLAELSLRDGDVEVSVRRAVAAQNGMPVVAQPHTPVAGASGPVPDAGAAESADAANGVAELAEIKSPMVGTFYAAPDPETPPFVQVGAHVNPDTVVCVVEAMKVFNEIKADTAGTIEKILVKNGQSIEYGQPLFAVRLS